MPTVPLEIQWRELLVYSRAGLGNLKEISNILLKIDLDIKFELHLLWSISWLQITEWLHIM